MSAGEAFPGVCTDWRRHDVPAMWQMLANEDGQHSWDQVTGWRQISELLNLHSGRLRTAREQLAASWPAGGSGAASVFMAFVDQLLGSMDGTATVAAGNSAALAGITTSLGTAREAMEQLHDQWQRYAEAEHHSTEPTIRRGSPGVLEPRLSQDWRQDLNQQGATVMTAMENEVLDYAQSTTVPARYNPVQPRDSVATFPARGRVSADSRLAFRPGNPEEVAGPGAPSNSSGPVLAETVSQLPRYADIPGALVPAAETSLGTSANRFRPPLVDPIAISWPRNVIPNKVREAVVPGADEVADALGEPAGRGVKEEPTRDFVVDPRSTEPESFHSLQPAPANPTGGSGATRKLATRTGGYSKPAIAEEWRTLRGVPPVLEPAKGRDRHLPGPGVLGIDR